MNEPTMRETRTTGPDESGADAFAAAFAGPLADAPPELHALAL